MDEQSRAISEVLNDTKLRLTMIGCDFAVITAYLLVLWAFSAFAHFLKMPESVVRVVEYIHYTAIFANYLTFAVRSLRRAIWEK
jgi:hypothetical protein